MIDSNRSIGFDSGYGRRLGMAMRSAGLSDVRLEGTVLEWNANHPLALLYALTFQRLRARAVESGAITREDHERLLAMMSQPGFSALSHTIFTARGHSNA